MYLILGTLSATRREIFYKILKDDKVLVAPTLYLLPVVNLMQQQPHFSSNNFKKSKKPF